MSEIFKMANLFGTFLADGDVGNHFRFCEVEPRISSGENVVFDFSGVTNMTDSFARACFETLAADHGSKILELVKFENCSPVVRDFISHAISSGLDAARREVA